MSKEISGILGLVSALPAALYINLASELIDNKYLQGTLVSGELPLLIIPSIISNFLSLLARANIFYSAAFQYTPKLLNYNIFLIGSSLFSSFVLSTNILLLWESIVYISN